jgi:protein-S-isoprenylcysteine O-methyltransferase
MTPRSPQFVGLLWGLSEFALSILKRSKKGSVSKDRSSLKIIWLANLAAVALGVIAAYQLPACRMSWSASVANIALSLFVLGIALRWTSIVYLGRFFTVNVAVHADHRVIDSGPYRFIRHPSYTGSLLAVFGFALSFQNWASLLIVFTTSCAATLYRIHIEEAVLLEVLGEPYRSYSKKTKRLLPLIY